MNYNYHTHTFRCGHASGTEEEYIKRAIDCGIKYMGFADHAPLNFPEAKDLKFRVPVDKVEDYFSTLKALREKYKDKIDLKFGFEMEYYPNIFEKMLADVKSFGAEYLILGEHFTVEEIPDSHEHSAAPNDSVDKLKTYVNRIIEGTKTGAFTYIAHPDMINFTGDLSIYKEEMRKICVCSREYNIPLELNCLGIRDNRHYPNNEFWQIAGEEQCPVTFGFDAHDVPSAYDGDSVIKAKELVKKYNLNYIGKPEIILLQK